jgi:hypothetical protein
MDEDNSSMSVTPKHGIRVPDTESSPASPFEPTFSVRSNVGSQSAVNAYTESKAWNIGHTKPPNQRTQPFAEDSAMKTYLSYFATGDLHSYWHGTKVRLEGTTTHPAQIRLTFDLLGSYCKPMVYAVRNPPYFTEWSKYAWRVVFDLDESFKFLISLPKEVNDGILNNDESFYAALGGFSDAEGFIVLKETLQRQIRSGVRSEQHKHSNL